MKDQYGIEIPSSLVSITRPLEVSFTHIEVQEVLKARWYADDADSEILVPEEDLEVETVSAFAPAELPIPEGVMQVMTPLKRYNEHDGFYHA